MAEFAIVFPGQGSQKVGMLAGLAEEQPLVRYTFDEASAVLKYDLWNLVQEGPSEKLDQTEFTQPALLAADVAVFRCWKALGGPDPQWMAGHSLGEYAALVCAESIAFEDAVLLVERRGQYMQEALSDGEGAMGAIIGLDETAVRVLCEEAAKAEVVKPANLNSPEQTVVSGHAEAVDRTLALAKAKGAKLAIRIPVSVPSHCPLMQPAADRLANDLDKINITSPAIPIFHNTDVALHTEPEVIRRVLIEQLVSPVRWVETIQAIGKRKIQLFLECGPDNKLAGLIRRIDRSNETLLLGTSDAMVAAISHLN